jgi:hypothetical protein
MARRANSRILLLDDETQWMALSERTAKVGTHLLVKSERLPMFATV